MHCREFFLFPYVLTLRMGTRVVICLLNEGTHERLNYFPCAMKVSFCGTIETWYILHAIVWNIFDKMHN